MKELFVQTEEKNTKQDLITVSSTKPLLLVLKKPLVLADVRSKGKMGTGTKCNKEIYEWIFWIKIAVRVIKLCKRLAREMVKYP